MAHVILLGTKSTIAGKVISSPLFESMTLMKTPKTLKIWSNSNSSGIIASIGVCDV